MDVKILEEHGHSIAGLGLGLSYGKTSDMTYCEFIGSELESSVEKTMSKLAHKQGGHNKFMESIMVWIDVTAPLYWWKQADTYRISSKQSESTMHTIHKKPLTITHFEEPESPVGRYYLEQAVDNINKLIEYRLTEDIIRLLPDSFLQRRIWCMSYKTLQNIYAQRKTHKLAEWRMFCEAIIQQIQHPEYIENERA